MHNSNLLNGRVYPYAIFDMDGTLVDSMPYWQSAGSDYVRSRGLEPEPELWKKLSTMSTEESAAFLKEQYGFPEDIPTIVEGFNGIMRENYRLRIPAKPGVPEYLKKLQDLGVTMCICSATSPHLVEMTLERLGILSFFDFITSCDDVGAGKDRPEVFELALRKLGAEPDETVMYEDADFAIRTAHSLGIHVAAVADPSCLSTREELAPHFDTYVESFDGISFCPQIREGDA